MEIVRGPYNSGRERERPSWESTFRISFHLKRQEHSGTLVILGDKSEAEQEQMIMIKTPNASL